jgi:hypothetical protein
VIHARHYIIISKLDLRSLSNSLSLSLSRARARALSLALEVNLYYYAMHNASYIFLFRQRGRMGDRDRERDFILHPTFCINRRVNYSNPQEFKRKDKKNRDALLLGGSGDVNMWVCPGAAPEVGGEGSQSGEGVGGTEVNEEGRAGGGAIVVEERDLLMATPRAGTRPTTIYRCIYIYMCLPLCTCIYVLYDASL